MVRTGPSQRWHYRNIPPSNYRRSTQILPLWNLAKPSCIKTNIEQVSLLQSHSYFICVWHFMYWSVSLSGTVGYQLQNQLLWTPSQLIWDTIDSTSPPPQKNRDLHPLQSNFKPPSVNQLQIANHEKNLQLNQLEPKKTSFQQTYPHSTPKQI